MASTCHSSNHVFRLFRRRYSRVAQAETRASFGRRTLVVGRRKCASLRGILNTSPYCSHLTRTAVECQVLVLRGLLICFCDRVLIGRGLARIRSGRYHFDANLTTEFNSAAGLVPFRLQASPDPSLDMGGAMQSGVSRVTLRGAGRGAVDRFSVAVRAKSYRRPWVSEPCVCRPLSCRLCCLGEL